MGVNVLVDRVQRLRTHNFLAVQVVSNVVVFVIPLDWNVADGITGFLRVMRSSLEYLII